MRHDLILLDLDGTLMDSAAGIISSIRHTYVTLGVPAPPDDELRRFVGPPITESFLAHGFTPESLPEAMRVYRADFAARGMHDNRVFDGIEETLTALVAAVVCLTLVCVVFIAKLVGCSLPILAEKLGFDPAVMASPFITTIVDVLSLLIYFSIASALLGL